MKLSLLLRPSSSAADVDCVVLFPFNSGVWITEDVSFDCDFFMQVSATGDLSENLRNNGLAKCRADSWGDDGESSREECRGIGWGLGESSTEPYDLDGMANEQRAVSRQWVSGVYHFIMIRFWILDLWRRFFLKRVRRPLRAPPGVSNDYISPALVGWCGWGWDGEWGWQWHQCNGIECYVSIRQQWRW